MNYDAAYQASRPVARHIRFEFRQRLGFDLTDPLAGHVERPADLLERVVSVHANAEPHPENAFLTRPSSLPLTIS